MTRIYHQVDTNMYKHGPCAGLCALFCKYIKYSRYFVVALDLISTWLFACLSSLQQLAETLGCNSFTTAISDPSRYVRGTSTSPRRICPGSVAPRLDGEASLCRRKPVTCWPIFNPYLLHLMFVALWRKPVICRSPYGSAWVEKGHFYPHHTEQCEASPADITCSGASLYCLGDEYMTQGKRTLTPVLHSKCLLPTLLLLLNLSPTPRMSTILVLRASSGSRAALTSRMLAVLVMILGGPICWPRWYIRLSRVRGVRSVPLMVCRWTTLFPLGQWPLVVVSSACPWLPTTRLK